MEWRLLCPHAGLSQLSRRHAQPRLRRQRRLNGALRPLSSAQLSSAQLSSAQGSRGVSPLQGWAGTGHQQSSELKPYAGRKKEGRKGRDHSGGAAFP